MDDVIKINFNIPIFHTKVSVVVGETDEPFKGKKQYFSDQYLARCFFDKMQNGNKIILIHSKSCAMSVIAHEAIHAANFILGSIGHKADFDNDEIQAYLVQHILEPIEKKIWGLN